MLQRKSLLNNHLYDNNPFTWWVILDTGFVQNFRHHFPWFLPEFLMISTHFALSFPIKIDMLFPESVVCKSHEVWMLCGRYDMQWPTVIVPCRWASGGLVPGQSTDGVQWGKTPGSSRDPTAYTCQKCQKYTLVVHLPQITISWILLIKVIKSSTEAAATNIIARLSVTIDKEN